jgi:hypothetical protein
VSGRFTYLLRGISRSPCPADTVWLEGVGPMPPIRAC